MKKLLPLAALTLIACNKPKCWTCTETVTHTHEKTTTLTREFCDKTRSEMEKFEKDGSYSNTYFDKKHNDTITATLTMSCKVKR